MARDWDPAAANYLGLGDVASVDITGTALTMAGWCQADAYGGGQSRFLIAKENGVSTGTQYWFGFSGTGQPRVAIGDASAEDLITGPTVAPLASRHHVCGVKDGGTIRAYLNGVLDASQGSTRTIQNTGNTVKIGQRSLNDRPFDGRIAEVALWDVALSAEEVVALAKGVSPALIRLPSLRAYWPILGIGSSEVDLTGRGGSMGVNGTLPAAAHFGGGRWSSPMTAG